MTRSIVLCDVDGVLSDGAVYVSASGEESLRFSKRDGWRLEEARAAGIGVELVTCDPSEQRDGPATHRARKLGVPIVPCGTPADKAEYVRRFKAEGARVVYIGDSPADLEAMRAADEAWCPADGLPGLPAMTPATRVDGWSMPSGCPADLGNGKPLRFTYAKGGDGVLHEVLGYLLEGAK